MSADGSVLSTRRSVNAHDQLAVKLKLELTRFRGHLILTEQGWPCSTSRWISTDTRCAESRAKVRFPVAKQCRVRRTEAIASPISAGIGAPQCAASRRRSSDLRLGAAGCRRQPAPEPSPRTTCVAGVHSIRGQFVVSPDSNASISRRIPAGNPLRPPRTSLSRLWSTDRRS